MGMLLDGHNHLREYFFLCICFALIKLNFWWEFFFLGCQLIAVLGKNSQN